jgi:hypothetical protein
MADIASKPELLKLTVAIDPPPIGDPRAMRDLAHVLTWENRRTLHCATPFNQELYTRRIHRSTREGETSAMAEVA